MKLKKSVIAVLFLTKFSCAFSGQEYITVTCPAIADVQAIEQKGSWAAYRYRAEAKVDFPEIGKLEMEGEGNSEKIYRFEAATWTDRTFLCVYNQTSDAVVIFESKLSQYVSRCYFHAPGHPECVSSNSSYCRMTCELSGSD